jgi:hypothetical protein
VKDFFGMAAALPAPYGELEPETCEYISGWAWDSGRADAPASVEVVENGRVVAAALADTLHPDIPTSDGSVYALTTVKHNALDQVMRVRWHAGGVPSPASPVSFS